MKRVLSLFLLLCAWLTAGALSGADGLGRSGVIGSFANNADSYSRAPSLLHISGSNQLSGSFNLLYNDSIATATNGLNYLLYFAGDYGADKRLAFGASVKLSGIGTHDDRAAVLGLSFRIIDDLAAGAGIRMRWGDSDDDDLGNASGMDLALSATWQIKKIVVLSPALRLQDLSSRDISFGFDLFSGIRIARLTIGIDNSFHTQYIYEPGAALEYAVRDFLVLRGGLSRSDYALGLSVRVWRGLCLDYGFDYHRALGPSNGFMVKYLY